MKEAIICWLLGHKPILKTRKMQRLFHWGDKVPRFEDVPYEQCERCGKERSPISGEYLSC